MIYASIKHVVRFSLLNVNVNLYFRHYKLEAEIASMTWRVNYRDIVRVPPGKLRGSVYSLVRRSSQCVSNLLGSSCYVMYTISQTFAIVSVVDVLQIREYLFAWLPQKQYSTFRPDSYFRLLVNNYSYLSFIHQWARVVLSSSQ